MKKKVLPKRLEKDIQLAICKYLKIKGHFFWRNNNTPIYDATRKCFRRMPLFSLKGIPDIILIKSVFYGIEVKTITGRLSQEQADFGKELVIHGGIYIVARSVDDIIECGL